MAAPPPPHRRSLIARSDCVDDPLASIFVSVPGGVPEDPFRSATYSWRAVPADLIRMTIVLQIAVGRGRDRAWEERLPLVGERGEEGGPSCRASPPCKRKRPSGIGLTSGRVRVSGASLRCRSHVSAGPASAGYRSAVSAARSAPAFGATALGLGAVCEPPSRRADGAPLGGRRSRNRGDPSERAWDLKGGVMVETKSRSGLRRVSIAAVLRDILLEHKLHTTRELVLTRRDRTPLNPTTSSDRAARRGGALASNRSRFTRRGITSQA